MYKDKEKQRLANKERMRKVRQGNTEGNTPAVGNTKPLRVGNTSGNTRTARVQGNTGNTIVEKLVDPVWREKLTRICSQFHKSPLAHDVQLGVNGPDLSVVEEMLEITA